MLCGLLGLDSELSKNCVLSNRVFIYECDVAVWKSRKKSSFFSDVWRVCGGVNVCLCCG